MRFRDIPQIPTAHYQVNVGWGYLPSWMENQQGSGYELDLNPEFQRDYVWTVEQKVKYVEYILRGGESGRDLYFNHPNWMGSMQGRMVIVDGKQRLSAVLDFLNNKIKAYGIYKKDFADKLRMTGPDFIIKIGCLKTDKEVYEWYLSMNTGGTYHTEEEIDKVKELIKGL